MCPFDQGGVGAPSCSFEGSRAEEVLIESDKSLSYPIGDISQVVGSELVRDQAADESLVLIHKCKRGGATVEDALTLQSG